MYLPLILALAACTEPAPVAPSCETRAPSVSLSPMDNGDIIYRVDDLYSDSITGTTNAFGEAEEFSLWTSRVTEWSTIASLELIINGRISDPLTLPDAGPIVHGFIRPPFDYGGFDVRLAATDACGNTGTEERAFFRYLDNTFDGRVLVDGYEVSSDRESPEASLDKIFLNRDGTVNWNGSVFDEGSGLAGFEITDESGVTIYTGTAQEYAPGIAFRNLPMPIVKVINEQTFSFKFWDHNANTGNQDITLEPKI